MTNFYLNKSIFEETHKDNTQLQTDLSNLQFQYLDDENNLSSLDNSKIFEIQEISENILLENEIWTEEKLFKFKILYYKTKDILEKPDDDNQKLEEEISSLENNEFKKSFDKQCCEKNCLQTQCDYSIALLQYLNFKNLSKSFQDMYLLGNRALSFEIVMNVITFIANYAKQNGLPFPVEEKETKVLEWHQHIEWAHKERENYKNYINIAYNDIQKFGISNLLRPEKPNSLNITIHLSWDYAQQI
ncbi:22374_t:CDS:2 [Cetraspora pellucida]|uniref:22374_t:CDS:1 n=1 Tax=Cetraspora pellucida TaxID=1433469 RepID=A0A9N9EM75_9GLOM|nr:22374_t:CDS:2 [Cetraspora pellucida]